jgi:hypothetical protein
VNALFLKNMRTQDADEIRGMGLEASNSHNERPDIVMQEKGRRENQEVELTMHQDRLSDFQG